MSVSTISALRRSPTPATLALARRPTIVDDGNPAPNALTPQRVEIDLAEGRNVACTVLGSPGAAAVAGGREGKKFDACRRTLPALPPAQGAALRNMVGAIDILEDVRLLGRMAAP